MRDSTKQIALVAAGAAFTYTFTISTPPATWWGWVLFFAGLGGNIVNAIRALFNSSVTDERTERIEQKAAKDAKGEP